MAAKKKTKKKPKPTKGKKPIKGKKPTTMPKKKPVKTRTVTEGSGGGKVVKEQGPKFTNVFVEGPPNAEEE